MERDNPSLLPCWPAVDHLTPRLARGLSRPRPSIARNPAVQDLAPNMDLKIFIFTSVKVMLVAGPVTLLHAAFELAPRKMPIPSFKLDQGHY